METASDLWRRPAQSAGPGRSGRPLPDSPGNTRGAHRRVAAPSGGGWRQALGIYLHEAASKNQTKSVSVTDGIWGRRGYGPPPPVKMLGGPEWVLASPNTKVVGQLILGRFSKIITLYTNTNSPSPPHWGQILWLSVCRTWHIRSKQVVWNVPHFLAFRIFFWRNFKQVLCCL